MRQKLLPKTIDIETRRDTKNKIMATDSDWSMKFRSLPCEIEIVSAKEQIFERRESVEKMFRLYCDDIEVDERDRVVGKCQPLEPNQRYEIIGLEPWNNYLMMRLRLWQ